MTNRIGNARRFAKRKAGLIAVFTLAYSANGFAAWRATGPFGGDAELVRAVPKVRDLVIAGAHNGLLFSSSNGGAYWTGLPFPAQLSGSLHALEVDSRSASTWYAGMESDSSWLTGVWKTSDAGKSWSLLAPTKGLKVWSLALWPGNQDIVAAGTSTGVWLSLDAGTSWKHISAEGDPELRPVVSLAFDPANSKILYAGTTHLPWRTADGGATWQSIHEGMIDDSDVFSIQVDQKNPARVFASACSGVYASTNSAGRWSKLSTPSGAFRTYFVAIDPKHPESVFAGTTGGLLKSPDGGKNWRRISPEAVRSIAFDPWVPGRIFFASSSAGMLLSTDAGATVRESNFGYTNRNFTTLTGSGNDLYSSSVYEPLSGGVYRTDSLALRWAHAGEPPSDQLLLMAAAPDNPRVLFAAGYRNLLESDDAGKSWSARKNPPPGTHIAALLPISSTTVLAGTDRGLFRSSGDTWTQAAASGVSSIGSAGRTVFALSADGAIASSDRAATWTRCGAVPDSSGAPMPASSWYGLAFDSGNPAVALAATSSGLFRSVDSCRSWLPALDGLRAETATLVLFHPTRPGEAFVSQGGKVYRSTDGGLRWLPLDREAPGSFGPSSFFVLPSAPDRLFALFPRRGVFSTSISLKETMLQ